MKQQLGRNNGQSGKFKKLLEETLDEYNNYFMTDDIDLCTNILEKLETRKEKLLKMYEEALNERIQQKEEK